MLRPLHLGNHQLVTTLNVGLGILHVRETFDNTFHEYSVLPVINSRVHNYVLVHNSDTPWPIFDNYIHVCIVYMYSLTFELITLT